MLLVHSLIDSVNGLKEDVKILLSMNKNLRDEIKSLKKHNQEVSAPATVFPKSFSEVIEFNNVQNNNCGTIAKRRLVLTLLIILISSSLKILCLHPIYKLPNLHQNRVSS